MQPEMVPLKGNTYPICAQLRGLGGEFDQAQKVWMVPADRINEARKLLQPGPQTEAKLQHKKERNADRPRIDLATMDALVKAQLRHLHGEVSIIGRWDANAEAKIHEFCKRIMNQGGNVDWVQRTLAEFRKKLQGRTKSDWRH